MLNDPEKIDFVRLKVSYNGKFGIWSFYLKINFDGILEIQFKDIAYGKVLINALANTLINGDEPDGNLNKELDDQFSIPYRIPNFSSIWIKFCDKKIWKSSLIICSWSTNINKAIYIYCYVISRLIISISIRNSPPSSINILIIT